MSFYLFTCVIISREGKAGPGQQKTQALVYLVLAAILWFSWTPPGWAGKQPSLLQAKNGTARRQAGAQVQSQTILKGLSKSFLTDCKE